MRRGRLTAATKRRAPVDPSRLTALDRAILDEVCWLRVVRQDQLGRLHPRCRSGRCATGPAA